MIVDSNQGIIDKFKVLKAKADVIFDVGRLSGRKNKSWIFERDFNPFYDSLESEIKSFASSPSIGVEIDKWAGELDSDIKKAGEQSMRNQFRKKLVVKLLEIKSALPIENISERDSQNTILKTLNENEIKNTNNFQPKPGLDEVVYGDYILQFSRIEQELISRGYLSDKYIWLQNKTTFCEFLVVIMNFKYTMSRICALKVRRFFEKRYGKEKNGLAEMFKPVKRPKQKTAEITFGFISPPVKIS